MIDWLFRTLRTYPEIAIFLTLAIGFYFGKFKFRGIGLGAVTATLLAGVLIGQIGITISTPLKATVFLMFLFAVGYGVGPQFVRGVAKDGELRMTGKEPDPTGTKLVDSTTVTRWNGNDEYVITFYSNMTGAETNTGTITYTSVQ